MTKAVAAAREALEVLAPVAAQDTPAGKLAAGASEGLSLGIETVQLVREVLARDREAIDVKLLRAGNDAGASLYKSALSAQQAQYQAQRDDDLARLIQIIAEERAKDAER